MHSNIENRLISLVRENGDSEALQKLIRKYQPMIDNMFKMYWISGYDRNDWYQESYIVCYETCLKFDDSQGSKFANFFKMRFNNHIISLIRAQSAVKRQANNEVCSFEEILAVDNNLLDFLHKPTPKMTDLIDNFEILIKELSDMELAAFQVIMGQITVEQACEKLSCSDRQLLRASSRCKTKIKKKMKSL